MSEAKRTGSAAIIGAGIGGLAIANILAKAGYQVTVYEGRNQLGGRAGEIRGKGFMFDTGPSWYLMPEIFEQYFALFGHKSSDFYQLKQLDPAYKIFSQGQPPLNIKSNPEYMAELFESLEAGAGAKLHRYLRDAEVMYTTARDHFLYNPFLRKKSLMATPIIKNAPLFTKIIGRSLHSHVSRYVHNLQLQQILEYPTVFLGASPYNAPALFSLMSYLDLKQGVLYPEGGMYQIVKALQEIGKNLGVKYRTDSPVEKILVKDGRANGLIVKGQNIFSDIVISNADLHFTETKLLDAESQTYPAQKWEKRVAGPTALLIYLGIKGALPELEHHNLYFTKSWEHNFSAIFKQKHWPKNASLYVSKASATDRTVAPKGDENLVILVPGPAGIELTAAEQTDLAEQYINLLAEQARIPNLRQRIVFQQHIGPREFSQNFHSWQGSALGPAHTLRQSAIFRPSNKSKKLDNLYYVGATTQPGIGVPMCLISAQLVYKHLTGDGSSGPLTHIRNLV